MRSTITKKSTGGHTIDIVLPIDGGGFVKFYANDTTQADNLILNLRDIILELEEYKEYVKAVQGAEEKWNNRNK